MALRAWTLRALAVGLLLAMPAGAEAQKLTGSLETVNGARVLKLWGSAYERGYTHGYLLGKEILELFNAQGDETKIGQETVSKMYFAHDRKRELEGMLAGITAAVGKDNIRLDRLDRDLSLKDLKVLNTVADWYKLNCSSFSAWGDFEVNGEMITARNLDQSTGVDNPLYSTQVSNPLVIVYLQPGKGREPWVSIAWAGLIGAYTAMNEEGVTISLHDSEALTPKHAGRFTPRSFALRDAIERISAATAIADARTVFYRTPVICGNNIHVSAPFTGQQIPAAVFEYDGDTKRDDGVTMRVAADNSPKALKNALLCTNHYCKRSPAKSCQTTATAPGTTCNRYQTMVTKLSKLERRKRTVDADIARQVMQAVSVDGTLHSVVFLPNRKELFVGFATPRKNGAQVEPVHFKLAELLAGP